MGNKIFISHDWGHKRANHNAVTKVVSRLRNMGHDVWFDDTHMKGNIIDAMCKGIDNAEVVLVFVTSNYMKKVASQNLHDNCRREFMYAARHPEKIIAVKFDVSLPKIWSGPIAMICGHNLYVDLCVVSEHSLERLEKAMVNKSERHRWTDIIARQAVPKTFTGTIALAANVPTSNEEDNKKKVQNPGKAEQPNVYKHKTLSFADKIRHIELQLDVECKDGDTMQDRLHRCLVLHGHKIRDEPSRKLVDLLFDSVVGSIR